LGTFSATSDTSANPRSNCDRRHLSELSRYATEPAKHSVMANKALNPHDEQTWLNMAETWLGMIPERQRTPNEFFQGTGEEPSKSLH